MKLLTLNLRQFSKRSKGKRQNYQAKQKEEQAPQQQKENADFTFQPNAKNKNLVGRVNVKQSQAGLNEIYAKYSKNFKHENASFAEQVQRQNNIASESEQYLQYHFKPEILTYTVPHGTNEINNTFLQLDEGRIQIPEVVKSLPFTRYMNQVDKNDHFVTRIKNRQNINFEYDQLSPNLKFLTLYRNSQLTQKNLSLNNITYKAGAYTSSFLLGYGLVDHIYNIGYWFFGGTAYICVRTCMSMVNYQLWHFNHAQKITQIDLMINWQKMRNDNISRHLKITMKNGTINYVSIDHIQPVVQTSYMYSSTLRRTLSGVQDMILIKCEDELMQLQTDNSDFAINEPILRAVLNGFCIDMKVPCNKYEQDLIMGTKLKQMQEDFKKRQTQYEGIDETFTQSNDNSNYDKSSSEDSEQESGSEFTQSEQELSDDQKQYSKQS